MREHSLWRLARTLKSLEEFRTLPLHALQPVVRRWWQLALPVIRTKAWCETWAAFGRCWERVRIPYEANGTSVEGILERARRAGCPEELRSEFGPDVCGLVAAICRELARESTTGRFCLHRNTLARLCGVSPGTASACLRALIGSRVIRRTRDPQPGRSTEYAYLRSMP